MSSKPIQRVSSLKFSRILKRNKTISQINVTPMVDVMLVLLVIFMITAPLLKVGVPINLPKTKAKALPEDQTPLSVTINKEEKTEIISPPKAAPVDDYSPTEKLRLEKELKTVEKKNKLLSENIDLDYLDTLYREKLKFVKKDEILIKLK